MFIIIFKLYQQLQMSECIVDIKIGCDGQQNKDLYKAIDITIELHQQKLIKLNQQMTSILSKTITPSIIIQYPILHTQNIQLFNQTKDYQWGIHKTNNKIYQFCNTKNKENLKLYKNIQKQFQKITKLNNNCNFKINLYNLIKQNNCQKNISLLNHMKIKGSIKTDPQLINGLTQIIRRLSIQFLNSPLMAFLELLQNLTLKLDLGPIQQFPEDWKQMFKYFDFSEMINKQTLKQLQNTKGQVIIHLTLPKLLSISIKSESSIFTKLLSIFFS